jgi:hypothetical protein
MKDKELKKVVAALKETRFNRVDVQELDENTYITAKVNADNVSITIDGSGHSRVRLNSGGKLYPPDNVNNDNLLEYIKEKVK